MEKASMPRGLRPVALMALACLVGLAAPVRAAEIHVLATGALSVAFKEIIPAFEKETGHRVLISWGPSYGTSPDALPTKIKAGQAMDVAFMVGAALDDHVRQGFFIADTRADLAQSRIGLAAAPGVAKPDIATPEAFRRALINAKSVAYSEGASGTYVSTTLFPKLGLAEEMKAKAVLIRGHELVGDALARGAADLGLQQVSELRSNPKIQFVGPIPESLQKVSVISAALGKNVKARDAALALIAFTQSPAAATLFVKTGLDPIKAP
ncbi:MAG: extracellular solute-binding protein [Proteobacteria bacterium]|nr:extracellular solute-binding protein [Pseudomonadota bacterium]